MRRPYLVALAGAANAGSAATLIGNPQNILIGQAGGIDFLGLCPRSPCRRRFLSLAAVYVAVALTGRMRSRCLCRRLRSELPRVARVRSLSDLSRRFVAVIVLLALFLTPLPRELAALAVDRLAPAVAPHVIAGHDRRGRLAPATAVRLPVRRHGGFRQDRPCAGWPAMACGSRACCLNRLVVMAPLTLVASNTIGNVPTIILILRLIPDLAAGRARRAWRCFRLSPETCCSRARCATSSSPNARQAPGRSFAFWISRAREL